MDRRRQELLGDLLKQVSRSFHLSLKFLPSQVREPISLAYLLARTSDTLADTDCLPLSQRLTALGQFARRLSGTSADPLDFQQISQEQGDPAERKLLQRVEDSLALLDLLQDADRAQVRQVLATIISGQELDLQRFARATASDLMALSTPEELDDYTYRVAGCVGEFWTRLCTAHLSPRYTRPASEMIEMGRRYGKGLQLVNILRDLPRDLRQGRCYLPATELASVNLKPADLLQPENETALRPVYDKWLQRAHGFLHDGWIYTNAYPRQLARVRISCALPVLIGLRTLQRLRTGRVLDASTRLKISRREVRSLVLQAFLRHPFPPLWQALQPEGSGPPARR